MSSSSTNSTDSAIASLTSLVEQISNILSKTLAQSQENNRALAAICGDLSYEWARSTCSAGSTIMPPGMLGVVGIVMGVVILGLMKER